MIDPTKQKIQELVPELGNLPPYPYNPETARAIVELEKIAQKTLWREDLEVAASSIIEKYRQDQQSYYIGMLEGRWARSIQLADVLRAVLKETKLSTTVSSLGYFFSQGQGILNEECPWNLTTDYDGQSQETKDFIGRLLNLKDN